MTATREAARCRNCQTPLSGEYCHHCGQREGHGDLLFSEAVGEAIGDAFSWDSRFWRTLLRLLFRPGFLTAEFIAGRRARYVPPFRLYLIISFAMFLTVSLTASDSVIQVNPDAAELQEALRDAEDAEGDAATSVVEQLETDSAPLLLLDPNDPETPAWLLPWSKRLNANARRIENDPGLFLDNLVDFLPQIMFLMLPLFALLLRLAYAFAPFHYLQHLVFALHYHSFAYLLYLLVTAAETLTTPPGGLLPLGLLIYLPLALRRTYGSSTGGAIGKSLLIYGLYFLLLAFGLALLSILVVFLL